MSRLDGVFAISWGVKSKEQMDEQYRQRWAAAKALLGNRCQVCGTKDSLVFHHRDPVTKIRRLSNFSYVDPEFWEEFQKCDLICRSCHAREHHLGGGGTGGQFSQTYQPDQAYKRRQR